MEVHEHNHSADKNGNIHFKSIQLILQYILLHIILNLVTPLQYGDSLYEIK